MFYIILYIKYVIFAQWTLCLSIRIVLHNVELPDANFLLFYFILVVYSVVLLICTGRRCGDAQISLEGY